MYVPPAVLLLLDKIFICTALAGSVAWLIDYSRHHGWSNPVGRTLIAKTAIITALLALSAASSLLPVTRFWQETMAWTGAVLLGAIGPVMAWRMWVFHRIRTASRSARKCPVCEQPVPED